MGLNCDHYTTPARFGLHIDNRIYKSREQTPNISVCTVGTYSTIFKKPSEVELTHFTHEETEVLGNCQLVAESKSHPNPDPSSPKPMVCHLHFASNNPLFLESEQNYYRCIR